MRYACLLAASVAVLAWSGVAQATDPAGAGQCFRSHDYQAFRPVSDHAFNIRVNTRDYYRIELQDACPTLTSPSATLITRVRGSDMICGPLDWDLRVRDSGADGFAVACLVKSQRRLTPDEVAALPAKERP